MRLSSLNFFQVILFKYWANLIGNIVTHFTPPTSFYTPLRTSENQWFSDNLRGYRKRPVTWNGSNKAELTISVKKGFKKHVLTISYSSRVFLILPLNNIFQFHTVYLMVYQKWDVIFFSFLFPFPIELFFNLAQNYGVNKSSQIQAVLLLITNPCIKSEFLHLQFLY